MKTRVLGKRLRQPGGIARIDVYKRVNVSFAHAEMIDTSVVRSNRKYSMVQSEDPGGADR